MPAGGTELLARVAERGAGVAFLPRFAVADACRRGALVELDSDIEPIRLQKQLFVHKGKPTAGPLRAFVELAGGDALAGVHPGRGCIGILRRPRMARQPCSHGIPLNFGIIIPE